MGLQGAIRGGMLHIGFVTLEADEVIFNDTEGFISPG